MKKNTNPKFKRKYITLVILLSIYLITRLFFLFSINLFSLEECNFGTITKELITGPKLPIFDYPLFIGSHYPGRLLVGFLTVPFYLIFGESGISVKLTFLTFSAGVFCLVYLFLDRFFSRKSAIISAILLTFSIPVYTLSTMSQSGPHIESLFFDILIMFLFYRIFFGKKQDTKYFILFGLASGFAIFVNYKSLIMIFTCLLFWFIFDKKFFLRKSFLNFIISFFIGLGPWIYYNLTHNFIGLIYRGFEGPFLLKVFGNELSFSRITQIVMKFGHLMIYMPKSFMFKDVAFFTANFFSYTYFLLFLCSFIFLFFYCRKSILKLILGIIPLKRFNLKPTEIKKETFILVYLIIFCVIYSISSFVVDYDGFGNNGYRFLLTFYAFVFIIISLFVTKLLGKKTKIIFTLLIIILFLFGVIGNLGFVSFRDIGKEIVYGPYCYDKLGERYDGEQCNNLIEDYQDTCFTGHVTSIRYRMINLGMDKSIEYCNKTDKKYKCICYSGIGQFINWFYYDNINYLVSECSKLDKIYRHCYYNGVGQVYGEVESQKYPALNPSCDKLDPLYQPACFEGFGQGMGQFIGVIPTQAIRQCNKIDKKYRPYCFKGLAWSLAEKFGDDPVGAGKIGKNVDEEYGGDFYKGIGSYIGLMFGHNLTRANEECDKLGENNIYCTQGLHNYINKTQYN